MFEWNDEDGLTDAIWGDLIEREDHIVPYPKSSSGNDLFSVEDYDKLKDEKICSQPRPCEQSRSGYKNELSSSNPDPNSQCHADHSDSRFCLDIWPNYPSIESSAHKDCDGTDQGSTSSCMFNDFPDTREFDRGREYTFAELSRPRDIENDSEHGQKEVDSFLDCDWTSITNFVDLDGIFRTNDSLVPDKLLSSKDSDSPCPLLRSENEESHGKRSQSSVHKVHEKKILVKSRRKGEEKNTPNAQHVATSRSQIINPSKHLETLHPAIPAFYPSAPFQQTQLGEPAYLSYFPSQQMLMGYGYPASPFPTVPLVTFVPPVKKNLEPAWGSNVYHGNAASCTSIQNQQEKSSKPLAMTPQEKIEKLRRRQQIQAMIAIKQQEKQFGQQIISDEAILAQVPLQMNPINSSGVHHSPTEAKVPSSEFKMSLEQDESLNVSDSSNDCALLETVFSELNNSVAKLDHNVRLCMRDSLFRLAKSAMDRRRANNGVVAGVIMDEDIHDNQETCRQDGSMGFVNAEADTNPMDRTVAHLLFHKPPQSPFSAHLQASSCEEGPNNKSGTAWIVKGKTPL